MPKEGYEIFEVYLAKYRKDIEDGNPILCELMPLSTFSRKVVRARISRSSDALPGGKPLWVREDDGRLQEHPWTVKIIEELDPEEVVLEAEATAGEMYGWKETGGSPSAR